MMASYLVPCQAAPGQYRGVLVVNLLNRLAGDAARLPLMATRSNKREDTAPHFMVANVCA
jgi:hypothetical protein